MQLPSEGSIGQVGKLCVGPRREFYLELLPPLNGHGHEDLTFVEGGRTSMIM